MHWHGLEVPIEMDGVAGLSQDPIPPGEQFIYEFTLHQNGTFFYHSHMPMQEMMGMIGLFIVHPKRPHEPRVDRDFGLILQEWATLPNNPTPNTLAMEFNWLTINGKAGPATTPMLVKLGERVRLRFVNLGMDHHPMHLHGHTWVVTGTEGGRIPRAALAAGQHGAGRRGAGARHGVRGRQPRRLDAPLPPAAPHDERHGLDGRAAVGPRQRRARRAGMEEGMGMPHGGHALDEDLGPSLGRTTGVDSEQRVTHAPLDASAVTGGRAHGAETGHPHLGPVAPNARQVPGYPAGHVHGDGRRGPEARDPRPAARLDGSDDGHDDPGAGAQARDVRQDPGAEEGRRAMKGLILIFLLAAPADPSLPSYTLADLEQRALAHNPAFAQAEAAVRATEAQALQAGLWPNPVVGYTGEEIPLESDRNDDREGRHGIFVAQEIPSGGKLRLSREVLNQDLARTRIAAEAGRRRLLGGLRSLYARTLAAQNLVEVREQLAGVAREAVETTSQLFNTGSADAADRLAIENEAALAESDFAAARWSWSSSGRPSAPRWPILPLAPGRLAGSLVAGSAGPRRRGMAAAHPRRESRNSPGPSGPRSRRGRLGESQGRAYPDLEIEAGVRDNRERLAGGRRAGREAFAGVGVRLPLWNRNQGGIAAAEAEVARAKLESDRVRFALEGRFAEAFSRYRQAAGNGPAPTARGCSARARRAYEMYSSQHSQMMATSPQVLIAQRTLFQLEEDYARTLARAWEAAVEIQNLLADEPLESL